MKIAAEFDTEAKTMKFFLDGQETDVRYFNICKSPIQILQSSNDCKITDTGKSYLSASFDVKDGDITKSMSFNYDEKCGKFIDNETITKEKVIATMANLIKEKKLNNLS